MTTPSQESGIETAIRIAGGQELLAQHLGVTQQWVSACKRRGYLPLEHAQAVENLTGVDRRKLINPEVLKALGLAEEEGEEGAA